MAYKVDNALYESIRAYDRRVLAEIKREAQQKDKAYQEWEAKQSKVRYGSLPEPAFSDNPGDKWMAIEEDLAKRRAGEMIYQRIK